MIHSQSATSEIHPGLQENKIQIVTTVRKITSVRQILYAMGFFFFYEFCRPTGGCLILQTGGRDLFLPWCLKKKVREERRTA